MLSLLGNLIWLITSWYIPLLYLLGGIILFPLFPFLFPLVKYSIWPFGRVVVSNSYLKKFKLSNSGSEIKPLAVKIKVSSLFNILWLVTFGWIIALTHIISLVLNAMSLILIITIPFALPNVIANARMVPIALMPLGRSIISSDLHKKLKAEEADKEFEKLKSS